MLYEEKETNTGEYKYKDSASSSGVDSETKKRIIKRKENALNALNTKRYTYIKVKSKN